MKEQSTPLAKYAALKAVIIRQLGREKDPIHKEVYAELLEICHNFEKFNGEPEGSKE